MAQRSFKLTDELDAQLLLVAQSQDRSVSNVIVRLLERALSQGSVRVRPDVGEGTPVDLSEKIKELEPAEGVGNPVGSNIVGRRTAATNVRATGEGTPLPKIAPRRQPR